MRRRWQACGGCVAFAALVLAVPASALAAPVNDEPENAIAIDSRLPAPFSGQLAGATPTRDPRYNPNFGRPDIWYAWQARTTGRAAPIGCSRLIGVYAYELREAGEAKLISSRSCKVRGRQPGNRPGNHFNHVAGRRYLLRVIPSGDDSTTPFSARLAHANGRLYRTPGVSVATSKPNVRTRVPALPITRAPAAAPRSVASLRLDRLAGLKAGSLRAAGELQVSVCLARGGRACAGSSYRYNPTVRAYLALASGRRDTSPGQLVRLTRTRRLTCSQTRPASNHHCVLSIPWGGIGISPERLPPGCTPQRCRVNLIASASHPAAGGNDRVVVGGLKSGRVDNRGEARISAAHYQAKRLLERGANSDRKPFQRRRPIARAGADPKSDVIHSVAIKRPREGEMLVVDGLHRAAIRALPYNVRTRTSVVLASGPRSTNQNSRIARRLSRTPTRVALESNFNCTARRSAHRSPCPIRKSGVIELRRSSKRTVYVNLVAGHGAIGPGSQRWRGSDRVRVGGSLTVRRYTGRECVYGGSFGEPIPGRCPRPSSRR